MAKLMRTRPNEVRTWDMEELLGLAAICELEAEEFRNRTPSGNGGASAPSVGNTRTTITRYTMRPKAAGT